MEANDYSTALYDMKQLGLTNPANLKRSFFIASKKLSTTNTLQLSYPLSHR